LEGSRLQTSDPDGVSKPDLFFDPHRGQTYVTPAKSKDPTTPSRVEQIASASNFQFALQPNSELPLASNSQFPPVPFLEDYSHNGKNKEVV